MADRIVGPTLAALFSTLLLLVQPLGAQPTVGADLGFQNDFVWRGLTRANDLSIQPAAFFGFKSRSFFVTAGLWASLEPFEADVDDISNVGTGEETLGEVDGWAQLDYRLVKAIALDVSVGFTRYTFHGDASAGGRGSEWDTDELYLKAKLSRASLLLGLSADFPLAFELSLWRDIGVIHGLYGEFALESDLPVLPAGEPLGSVLVRLVSGWSFGQDTKAGSALGYYDGEGPTHLDLSMAPVLFFPIGPAGVSVYLAGHLQFGIDRATRRTGLTPDDRATLRAWWQITFSTLFPLERTP